MTGTNKGFAVLGVVRISMLVFVVGAASSTLAAAPEKVAEVAKPEYGNDAKRPEVALAPLTPPAKKLAPAELAAFVDEAIERRLAEKKLEPAPLADDAEFLRRASLDVVGVIPTAERVEAFLADRRSDKRALLVDELLATPEYARHQTDLWRELLIPTTAASLRREHQYAIEWLNESFAQNKPWDRTIREMLTADGFQDENGAVTILMTHQSLDEITDRVAKVLLGAQLLCAQCHNHPFQDWKQDEYWELAAFFKNVRPQYAKVDKVERYGVSERGDRKPIMTPASYKEVPAGFLRNGPAKLTEGEPALPIFAGWLTAPENPWFARSFVNRTWRQFFGRGLVEPIDDLRGDNPATHPEVLDELARQFVAHDFDVPYLIRSIAATRAYGRTSAVGGDSNTAEAASDATAWYGRMTVRVLQPFPLYDSVERILALGDDAAAAPPAKLPENRHEAIRELRKRRGTRDGFAGYFAGEEGAAPTSYQAGLPQALRLMNGKELQYRPSKASTELRKRYAKPEEAVDYVFRSVLSRHPASDELQTSLRYVETKGNGAYTDLIWALMNGTEFLANH